MTTIRHLFLPSTGVIAIFANSIPSMQLTFNATTSVPSGLVPQAAHRRLDRARRW
jgi:hypothetical protein